MSQETLNSLTDVFCAAQRVAKRYYEITGKPLGITGEIGEYHASQILGLKLAEARQAGYDATGSDGKRIQIKSRCLPTNAKPGQRLGSIRLDHEWDSVLLVLMNSDFEPLEMYEAQRSEVERALTKPGSKARNERGALAVSAFKQIAVKRWERPVSS